MRTSIALAAAASFLLASCSPKEPDTALIKKTMADYNAASKAGMMGGDLDKPLSYFEDDGMEMPPNMAMAKGKDAIKAMWTQMSNSGMKVTALDLTPMDFQASGSLAYEAGNYEIAMSSPQMGEMKDKGKYLSVWHQQPDGSWKLRADTWNSDTPMPPMEKPNTKKK